MGPVSFQARGSVRSTCAACQPSFGAASSAAARGKSVMSRSPDVIGWLGYSGTTTKVGSSMPNTGALASTTVPGSTFRPSDSSSASSPAVPSPGSSSHRRLPPRATQSRTMRASPGSSAVAGLAMTSTPVSSGSSGVRARLAVV